MNRPTIDIDELLYAADEALAAHDFLQAVEILRKATSVAPLRRDIRNKLAVALERSPVTHKVNKPQNNIYFEGEPEVHDGPQDEFTQDFIETDPSVVTGTEPGGREAIGQIARKAFEAAAGQTARASEATRNLTNLLHHGIKTWKSSLAEAGPGASKAPALPATIARSEISDSNSQSPVFTPERELNEYLKRASDPGTSTPALDSDMPGEELEDEVEESRVVRPAKVSNMAASTSSRKKSKKPADVEDVLAAGIGGFIEAVSTINKTKLLYACVYTGMGALFTFACIDVSKKFPAVEAVPGQQLQAANLGGLNLSETFTADEAISESRGLVASGKTEDAIYLLRSELDSGRFLHNRDLVRIELAALLNGVAEQHLRANDFSNSVSRYREAVSVLPTDMALQLRLGNALYYFGSLGAEDPGDKESLLAESVKVLEKVAQKDSNNLQAHRLIALVHSARGNSKAAGASWKKVKALAAAGSAEFQEAESHLK